MYDLTSFGLKEMSACGAALRQMGVGATSMEEVGNRTARYLYEHLGDSAGKPAVVLARFFITYPYAMLDSDLRAHVDSLLGGPVEDPGLPCQVLLATAGVEPDWNDRKRSVRYKALPPTTGTEASKPMFAQVSDIYGIVLQRLAARDRKLLAKLEQQTYDIFYVRDAVGSDAIPAQEKFVVPYGVRSVLGFFGMLPSGNLFTVVLFANVLVPKETTEYLRTLALNVKMAVLPFDETRVFAASAPAPPDPDPQTELARARSRAGSLEQLLGVHERVVGEQSERIAQMLAALKQKTHALAETNTQLEAKIAENVRLRQRAAETAVLEERQRLARELHDSVSQALYGIGLGVQTALTLWEQQGAAIQAADLLPPLQYSLTLAKDALAEMRTLIFELRPEALEVEGLIPTLRRMTDALQAHYQLEVQTSFAAEPDLSTAAKEMLYRVTQEALHNVVKHANATRVVVSLTTVEGDTILEIDDNGAGFDAQGHFPGHLGLRSMRERVEGIGGTFRVESAPGTGTLIKVRIRGPLAGKDTN